MAATSLSDIRGSELMLSAWIAGGVTPMVDGGKCTARQESGPHHVRHHFLTPLQQAAFDLQIRYFIQH
jgi:hypothetical protein